MTTTPINEDSYAEQASLEWLRELGWEVVEGKEIAPGAVAAERAEWQRVVLEARLRAAIVDLNAGLPRAAVEQVVRLVVATASPEVILDHQAFHEMLLSGVPVTFRDEAGTERSARARLVDFESPDRNDFAAVRQFVVISGTKNRRPDVLLFVNGISLGQIELKNPASKTATAQQAANQVAHYVETIPQLYRFVEVVAVSDVLEARLGTISTPAEHYAEWRAMDPAEEEGRSRLEVLIAGVFEPTRFLDIVRNFVLFEADGARTWKVLAKYQQVDAVNRAVESTFEAMRSDGRAGIVWHTQGSGKSYSMVFFVAKMRRDARFENPTIVAVCDRLDLDDQLLELFATQKTLAPAIKHAESITELHALLQVPADDIIFTTIHKFQPPAGEVAMPVLSVRRNVIVIADEAHRSHYDGYARNLASALPNATRIGFTGTPIEKADRSTRLVFGDYISIYRMERSQEDGTTVPIYYESRRIPISTSDGDLVAGVEEVLEVEDDETKLKLVTSWAKLERLVGADARLDVLAADIASHFTERCETLPGKGLVVAMSQRIAAELTTRLQQALGEDAVTCVISAAASDDPAVSQWRRSKQERKHVEALFKDPDSQLRLVVVRDMWLTGFDVPSMHTIYVDKPMRDHGLLQAITRVNRVFRDKPGGLVVDYIGIGEDLRASLSAYSDDVAEEALIPIDTAVKKLREKHDILAKSFFHDIDYAGRHTMSAAQRSTLFFTAVNKVIGDDDERDLFLKESGLLSRWFRLVSPHQAAVAIADDVEFFLAVRSAVIKVTTTSEQASPETEITLKQFFSEGLAAGEVVDLFDLKGGERPEISILSDDFLDFLSTGLGQPNLAVRALQKLLRDELRIRERVNHMQAKLFGDALSDLISRYDARQLSSADVIARLIELAQEMRRARRRHEQLGLTVEESAFYDALAGDSQDWKADETIATIARELVASIRADLTIDWADHESTEAAIRKKIKRLLRKNGFTAPLGGRSRGSRTIDQLADDILDQARTLYRAWPDTFDPDSWQPR